MGFLSNLFKRKEKQSINRINLAPLPEAIETQLPNNPYNDKYNNLNEEELVYILYCDYATCERWIKDASSPEIYFENYIKALQILMKISNCSEQSLINNNNAQPVNQIQQLRQEYSNYTNSFIMRYWNSSYKKISTLKTEKGKLNRINNFFNSFDENYHQYLTNDNVLFLEKLKNENYTNTETLCNTSTQNVVIPISTKCREYDVSTIENIRAIPNGDFNVMRPLQKMATDHKRAGNLELAIECLRKSNSISDTLPDSRNALMSNEYLRLVKYLEKLDKNLAEQELLAIKRKHPEFWDKRITSVADLNSKIKTAKEWNNDLILITSSRTCSMCSQYDNQVYSISGKSTKFPILPTELYTTGVCTEHYILANIFNEDINTAR